MVKQHLKRIAAPRTWHIKRKTNKFIIRPHPGAHPLNSGMSLSSVLTMLLKVAKTMKESKTALHEKIILVDGKRRKEHKLSVGFMDVISFPEIDKHYRLLLDKKGRLTSVEISKKEASTKLSKITSKTKIEGGKVQLNFSDGRNLIVNKDTYKTGDVLLLNLPSQKIESHLKFDKKMNVLLVGGKHMGDSGIIEEIHENTILCVNKEGKKYETLRKYAFIIGKDKPLIKLE